MSIRRRDSVETLNLDQQDLLLQGAKASLIIKDIAEVTKPIVEGFSRIIAGWASNPITGIPLMAATSEILYQNQLLKKEYAAILLSPSAILELVAGSFEKVSTDVNEFFETTPTEVKRQLKNFSYDANIIDFRKLDSIIRRIKIRIKQIEELIRNRDPDDPIALNKAHLDEQQELRQGLTIVSTHRDLLFAEYKKQQAKIIETQGDTYLEQTIGDSRAT